MTYDEASRIYGKGAWYGPDGQMYWLAAQSVQESLVGEEFYFEPNEIHGRCSKDEMKKLRLSDLEDADWPPSLN